MGGPAGGFPLGGTYLVAAIRDAKFSGDRQPAAKHHTPGNGAGPRQDDVDH